MESRLSVIDARTNGPALCAVFQTVSDVAISTATEAPARPEAQRGPDQRREDDVGHVALGGDLGQQHERRQQGALEQPRGATVAAASRGAQARIAGVTTSAPEKSDSHHVRQTSPVSCRPMTSAEPQRRRPEAWR